MNRWRLLFVSVAVVIFTLGALVVTGAVIASKAQIAESKVIREKRLDEAVQTVKDLDDGKLISLRQIYETLPWKPGVQVPEWNDLARRTGRVDGEHLEEEILDRYQGAFTPLTPTVIPSNEK